MWQGLCKGTVSVRLSVRPSVCLSHLSTVARRCGGFAAAGPTDSRYRSIAQQHGAQQQMRAVTRCQPPYEAGHALVHGSECSGACCRWSVYAGGAGDTGFSGTTGQTGAAGQPGRIGSTGSRGQPGLAGLPGDRGQQGLAGQPGDKGSQGSPGQMGGPGAQGDQGSPGQKGTGGNPGRTGRDGQPGTI